MGGFEIVGVPSTEEREMSPAIVNSMINRHFSYVFLSPPIRRAIFYLMLGDGFKVERCIGVRCMQVVYCSK